MDHSKDSSLLLKHLVEFINTDEVNKGGSPSSWRKLEKEYGRAIYREVLFLFTQTEFDENEAKRLWFKILDHHQEMQDALGRNPGLLVSISDYIINIKPKLKNLVLVDIYRLLQKERSALIDDLTGLYNRRFFNQVLRKELENSKRSGQPFSLLILDVDNFKEYNDKNGHRAGDDALVDLARILTENSRTIDHLVRYGGEEFVMILPRSEKDQAIQAAERYRRAVRDHEFQGQEKMPEKNLTATIGLAVYPSDAREGLELFELADEALYMGKKYGRNMVMPWGRSKRRYARFPIIMDILLGRPMDGEEVLNSSTTMDLSMGGALCYSNEPVPEDEVLSVSMESRKGGGTLNLKARVVRLIEDFDGQGGYYLGLSFNIDTTEQRKILESLIRKKAAA